MLGQIKTFQLSIIIYAEATSDGGNFQNDEAGYSCQITVIKIDLA